MQLSFIELWEKSKRYLEQGFVFRDITSTSSKPSLSRKPRKKINRTRSSDPILLELWTKIAQEYFPQHLHINTYSINWSKRSQKRTLASCNISHLRVNVARELNYPEYQEHLEPLLYHEMCHAALGLEVPKRRGKRQWHGHLFKSLERQHPRMQSFDAWVKSGGWQSCVRSDRGKRAALKRQKTKGLKTFNTSALDLTENLKSTEQNQYLYKK